MIQMAVASRLIWLNTSTMIVISTMNANVHTKGTTKARQNSLVDWSFLAGLLLWFTIAENQNPLTRPAIQMQTCVKIVDITSSRAYQVT